MSNTNRDLLKSMIGIGIAIVDPQAPINDVLFMWGPQGATVVETILNHIEREIPDFALDDDEIEKIGNGENERILEYFQRALEFLKKEPV